MRDPEQATKVVQMIRESAVEEGSVESASNSLTVQSLPDIARDEFKELAQDILTVLQTEIFDQLHQVLGELSGFVKLNSEPQDFYLSLTRDNPLLNMQIGIPVESSPPPELDISNASLDLSSVEGIYGYPDILDEETIEFFESEIFRELATSAETSAFAGLPLQSFYLPAARSGIAQGHKVLSAALVRQSFRIGIDPIHIPTLPGITTEFLSNLISLDRRMRRRSTDSALEDAISFIENEVLHGKIDLDESSGLPIPEIVYMPVGGQSALGKFTLDQTSSMITELAPLILFLKYLVRPGDMLILEEPESHLHPAAQRRMAQGIVRLVNAGVKVIITTHSDMFVGQINNFLALSQASQELIGEHGFEPSDFLKHDQVGAYLFKHDQEKRGSVIQPLGIDSDTGIDEDEFADVTEAIYNESIALQRDRIL
jgi:hypothetical protein